MTIYKAIRTARRLARNDKDNEYYVIYERGDGYQVADDLDLDTFWYGAHVVATALGKDIFFSND